MSILLADQKSRILIDFGAVYLFGVHLQVISIAKHSNLANFKKFYQKFQRLPRFKFL